MMDMLIHQSDELFRENAISFAQINEDSCISRFCLNSFTFYCGIFADRLEKVDVQEEEVAKYLDPVLKKLGWLSAEDLVKRIISLEFNRMLEFYKGSENLDIPEERKPREKNAFR